MGRVKVGSVDIGWVQNMIIAVGILVFIAICALSLVGLGESHSRVSRILNEMDDQSSETRAREPSQPRPLSRNGAKDGCLRGGGFYSLSSRPK